MPAGNETASLNSLYSRPNPLGATGVLALLCGGVPLWVLFSIPDHVHDAWMGALIAALIAGARFAWIIGSPVRRPYEMSIWLFFYVFLGIAPMVQLRMGSDPTTTPNISHEYSWIAAALVVVTELGLIAGSMLARRSGEGRTRIEPRRVVSQSRTTVFSGVFLAAAIAYILVVGPATLFSSRIGRNAAIASMFGDDLLRLVIGSSVSLGLLVVVVAQLQLRHERTIAGRSIGFGSALVLGVSVLALLVIVNPISSPRYIFGVVVLGILAALGAYAKSSTFRLISIGAMLALVVVFPLLDSFRYDESAAFEFEDPLTSLSSADFDGFAQIVNVFEYVENTGLTWGVQLLGVLLFWVPRSVWPGKPVDTGILLADYKGYAFTNLSAPLPAELYVNFGWLAVVVGAFVIGYAARRADASNEFHLRLYGVPTVLGCVVPFYLLLMLRGSALQAASNLAVILLAWVLVTRRSHRVDDDSRVAKGKTAAETL